MSQCDSVRYNFAHSALPVIALWNSKDFYARAFHRGSREYLLSLWKSLEERTERNEKPDGLGCHIVPLSSGRRMLLITLPTPREVPEAFFVGAIATVEKGLLFGETVKSIRYLTLELGTDPSTDGPAYFVCEWKSPNPKPLRASHGTISGASEAAFVEAADNIDSDRIHRVMNSTGELAGKVIRGADGKCAIVTERNADMTSQLFAFAIVAGTHLRAEDARVYEEWAGITGPWASTDYELFALSMLQFLHSVKLGNDSAPPALSSVAQLLPANELPQIPQCLTTPVKQLFCKLVPR